MCIVVIHPSVTNRRIVANVLRKTDHTPVRTFATPTAAFQSVDEEVDLLITDKDMTLNGEIVRDGFGASDEAPPSVLVVGYDFTEEEAVEVIREGAEELLLMPFSPDELVNRVRELTA